MTVSDIDEYNERRAFEKARKKLEKKELRKHERGARAKVRGEGRCRNPDCRTGQRPEWHHIVPRSQFASRNHLQNHEDNAVPLCHHCHMTWHQNVTVLRRSDLKASEVAFILENAGQHFLDRHYPE